MKPKTVKRSTSPARRAGVTPALDSRMASAPTKPQPHQVPRPKRAKARALRPPAKLWQLRLYVMDSTPKSQTAFANLKQCCETHLKGRYRITVIDLLKHPHLAKGDQILAIPTVVRKLPKPVRTIIGNLSDTERVLIGLDLRAAD